jgi:hypothetical protein
MRVGLKVLAKNFKNVILILKLAIEFNFFKVQLLDILATNASPEISFNPTTGKFKIIGNSLPENAIEFYKPVIEWLKLYVESPNTTTELVFKMTLLNTSSRKAFIDIFELLNSILKKSDLKILWYYNSCDEDIEEVGLDFKEYSKASFELICINSEA